MRTSTPKRLQRYHLDNYSYRKLKMKQIHIQRKIRQGGRLEPQRKKKVDESLDDREEMEVDE